MTEMQSLNDPTKWEETPHEIWLPLDFAVRCTDAITRIWSARAWGLITAVPQSGKSMTAMHLREEQGPSKHKDGTTRVTVIIGESRGRERPQYLAKTLAMSLGLPNRANLAELARGMALAKTQLAIVTDGHNMVWHEWGDLLTLHNTCKEQYGLEFALAVLCVRAPNLYASSPTDPLAMQIRDRLTGGVVHLPGHTDEKIGEAVRLIGDHYAPTLAGELSRNWAGILKAFQKRDLAPGGEISSRPLVNSCVGRRRYGTGSRTSRCGTSSPQPWTTSTSRE